MKNFVLTIRIILVVGVPIAVGLYLFLFLKSAFLDPVAPGAIGTVSFMVQPGSNFTTTSEQLAQQGFVLYPWVPRVIARIKKIDTKAVRTGEYALSRGMTPYAIVTKLASGDVIKRRVTVIEGSTLRDVNRAVALAGLIPEQDFWKALHDPFLLKKWGIPALSFEGYLYPETYFFSLPVRAEDIIGTMIKEGEKVWPEEYTMQAEKLQMSRHEVLTLASIIEKESGDPAEQPIISSVFHNRLANGMKLQADPTVIYGIENFNGNLTKDDLKEPTPYNTYVIDGLPKGPIANPGKIAIHAALFPESTPYLYFVSTGNGKHTFSTGLAPHKDAVQQLVELEKSRAQADKPAPAPTPAGPGPSLRPTPRAPVISVKPKR